MDYPDSPEAIALALLMIAISLIGDRNEPTTVGWLLDTFAECLAAARGERGERPRLH